MATSIVNEAVVRIFLLDKKELNPLLRGVRWSPEEIEEAVNRAIGYFNETPPFTASYNKYTFPYPTTLILGVAGWLLKSASINEASNNLSYQADGVSVNDKDKASVFASMGSEFWQQYMKMVQDIKIANNVSDAFGSLHSEHGYFAR